MLTQANYEATDTVQARGDQAGDWPISRRVRVRRRRVMVALILALSFHSLLSSVTADDPTPTALPTTDTAADVAADPFLVDGDTSTELLQHIRRVKRLRPAARTREAVGQHIQRQVKSIEQAADRISALSDATDREQLAAMEETFVAYSLLARIDSESAHDKVVALNRKVQREGRQQFIDVANFQLLRANVARSQQLGSDPMKVADEIATYVDHHGVDRVLLGYAESLGVRMTRRGASSAAAKLFGHLATAVRQSDDDELKNDLPYLESTSRRLSLPGNFMALKGQTADGNAFDWDSYRGKYVLIDFWATWCAPCRAEVPNLRKHLELYADKGFAVVGINIDEERSEFDEYMEEAKLPWQQIMPAENGRNPVAEFYGINAYPTIILAGPDGKVISMDAGGERLGELLAEHLGPVAEVSAEPTE